MTLKIDFKNKTLNEHKLINLNNNKNIEMNIKKENIKYRPNSKEKESNNNRIISSSIKKKLLNPELNKVIFNGKTLNNLTNKYGDNTSQCLGIEIKNGDKKETNTYSKAIKKVILIINHLIY